MPPIRGTSDESLFNPHYWSIGDELGVIMKVQLQLSIDHLLKARLQNIHDQTGIPISKTVADILERHLREYEQQHRVQPQLPNVESQRR